MPARRQSRRYGIATASLAAHVAVLMLVAVHAPRLLAPPMELGRPEPIIPVLIMPRTPPSAASPGGKPTPVRLHRRPQRFVDPNAEVAPLVLPETPDQARATAPTGPRTVQLPKPEDALAVNARNALRSRTGCDNPALTRAEREACEERFAAGGRDAPFLGLGIDRDKASELGRAAARREADYRYKRSLPGPAASAPTAGGAWDSTRSPPTGDKNKGAGTSAQDLGATPLRVPF